MKRIHGSGLVMLAAIAVATACGSDSSSGGSGGSGGGSAGSGGSAGTGGSAGGGGSSGSGGSSASGGSSGTGGSSGSAGSGGSAGASGTGGASGSGGAAGAAGITPQPKVQNNSSVTCADYTVAPNFSTTAYPCDSASLDAAGMRAVFNGATALKFLAGNWANSGLGGGCDQSTLCGQQFDPTLLLISKAAYASLLNPSGAPSIPGIDVAPSTPSSDMVDLMYNCFTNFPQGYKLGTPPIPAPTVVPIVDDVRTGEMLVWASDGTIYRARIDVVVDGTTDIPAATSDVYVFLREGAGLSQLISSANVAITALANSTGTDVHVSGGIGDSVTSNDIATFRATVACMQRDKDINP